MSVGHATRVLAQVEAGHRARIVDASEVGAHDGARRVASEMLALFREAAARFDETGARDLFVGHPFLTGVMDGYLLRGPLVLHPYELERAKGGAQGFTLVPRQHEPPIVNQALLRLLFSKLQYSFSDDLAERLDQAASEGAEAVLEALTDAGVQIEDAPDHLTPLEPRDGHVAQWRGRQLTREPCAVLGFFASSPPPT